MVKKERQFPEHLDAPVQLDLEALLEKETVADVLKELKTQTGLSLNKLLDTLAFHDLSLLLLDVEISTFDAWIYGIRKPAMEYAQAIEQAIAAITGKHEPVLTRFYATQYAAQPQAD